METDERIPAGEKRRISVYVDDEDVFAKVLDLPEADYQCVTVNGSWPEKGLIEGDVVLVSTTETPRGGDIVMIEDEGAIRLGLLSEPGWLETPYGTRSLQPKERIAGVGVSLARRLHK